MKPAHYCVVRFIADPGRNEALNIGILAWDGVRSRIRLDGEAIKRVVTENPSLALDALLDLEPMLTEALADCPMTHQGMPREILANHFGFPLNFTEARFTGMDDGAPGDGLDDTLDRLIKRIVKPRRRHSGGHNPIQILTRRLARFMATGAVSADYRFPSTETGVSRRADFYANSTTNVALDILRLSLKEAAHIRERVDAEAFKVEDVLRKNRVRYWVYCDLPKEGDYEGVIDESRKILRSVNAEVFVDLEATARDFAAAIEGD